ncbi:FAD-binding oxidoreductase [Ahrensia kielensis]|uniref:FAD-binding oxidoreductase n=1 Tax=Ahrensia kielensis TaxID=76980 RepID=A0ABU9T7S2_9HYPH
MNDNLREKFIAIVGAKNARVSQDDIAPYLHEWRDRWEGKSDLVLLPANTQEVSQILALATETKTPVVPQGGHTGLVGGGMPDMSGDAIILATGRMNKVRNIDTAGNTITVEAGCILQSVQEAADEAGKLFPLSLGAQGSCQIGGNLSSNAGGTGALAYGVARDLVLGLEVVLPTGEILNDLNALKKDNTGYNLRHLFIGAEGTLGIITAAVLKLFPKPKGQVTAFLALETPAAALELFQTARDFAGQSLTAFELMPRLGVEFTSKHVDGVRDPLTEPYPWYVLIEVSSGESEAHAQSLLENLLENQMEAGIVIDGAVAASVSQSKEFWHLREAMSESQKPEGGSIKHDISVPVHAIPSFMQDAEKAVLAIEPNARICAFGHLGDGNLHYNISQPVGADKQEFLAMDAVITPAVHALVLNYNGSISAEHGIGQMKRDELAEVKDPVALDLMRRIKANFDPAGIMNPNKVI